MSENQNPPKRPRLSLQIKAISSGPNLRASRTIAAVVNPTSPTSFNTLSNVYATAIDRSTPLTAINTKQPLKLQTQNLVQSPCGYGAPTPFAFPSTYPETPLTAQPISPAVSSLQQDIVFPSTMTATPPLSAGPVDSTETKSFLFATVDSSPADPLSINPAPTASSIPPTTSKAAAATTPTTPTTTTTTTTRITTTQTTRRSTVPLAVSRPAGPLPYVRDRSLHSILRNSPLPPPTARTPISPRRQSQRLAEKAARRVGYESPIERVIVTNHYVRSHIDLLLADDGTSPLSAQSPHQSPSSQSPSDPILGLVSDDTRDGGMTPGPFEEMRRRMAGLAARTPTSPVGGSPAGIRKKRRKDRGRRWVWTIGNTEDDQDDGDVGGAIAAIRAAARAHEKTQDDSAAPSSTSASNPAVHPRTTGTTPTVTVDTAVQLPMDIVTPSIETFEEAGVSTGDVEMSDSDVDGREESRALSLTPGDMDVDMITPIVARKGHLEPILRSTRQDSEGLFNPETGSRRDTPIPADMVALE